MQSSFGGLSFTKFIINLCFLRISLILACDTPMLSTGDLSDGLVPDCLTFCYNKTLIFNRSIQLISKITVILFTDFMYGD